jgi:uncharacterized Zn finger protein
MARAVKQSTTELLKAAKPADGPPCPKCGLQKGWSGPAYQQGRRVVVNRPNRAYSFESETIETIESLIYSCNACGYVRHEACKSYTQP